ncbi:MAG: hypothetical protein ABEI80_01920 [Haloplanus sp.]
MSEPRDEGRVENDAEDEEGRTAVTDGITARYHETADERVLVFEYDDREAVVAQNREGYAMVTVRRGVDGDELERYYGFDMALDHAAELLGVDAADLPVPDPAADMGM